jgi:hypothetical protein
MFSLGYNDWFIDARHELVNLVFGCLFMRGQRADAMGSDHDGYCLYKRFKNPNLKWRLWFAASLAIVVI